MSLFQPKTHHKIFETFPSPQMKQNEIINTKN